MSYLIKNTRIINPALKQDFIGDILIENGKISDMKENIDCEIATVIDGTGLVSAPGLVDIHVHLRDPGQTHKEDIETGCNAAVAGGVTSVLCMPNTNPTIDNVDTINYIKEKAKNAKAKVYIAAAITKNIAGVEKTDIESLINAGATALSDDGQPTEDTSILFEAIKKAKELGVAVVTHCEDKDLAKNWVMNEGETSKRLGINGVPTAAEDAGTARDMALAMAIDAPLHICHVSTANSANMIRNAKKDGYKISGETSPHYLLLSDKELEKRDADYKMNPPLRCENDRLAMINAVVDGTIEVIATDHAPHAQEEKADLSTAMNGVIGMETSLAGVITAIGDTVSLSRIIELMSVNPAKIINIDAGVLDKGKNADIVIFDPKEKWVVDVNKLHGKSKNAVLKNMELKGKVKYCLVDGEIVFKDAD